jgi:hypothetical protein
MAMVRYTVLDGAVLAEKRMGVRREYVLDPLCSTTAMLDSNQTLTDTFSYWPYGEEQARTGTTTMPFRCVGTLGEPCTGDGAGAATRRVRRVLR